jgi:hypothetical protein
MKKMLTPKQQFMVDNGVTKEALAKLHKLDLATSNADQIRQLLQAQLYDAEAFYHAAQREHRIYEDDLLKRAAVKATETARKAWSVGKAYKLNLRFGKRPLLVEVVAVESYAGSLDTMLGVKVFTSNGLLKCRFTQINVKDIVTSEWIK